MSTQDDITEERKHAEALKDAQNKALLIFNEIEKGLIRTGISEKALSDEIHAPGTQRHGIRTHWHKRVVRSGPNTLCPYAGNPPDRVIEDDDILFVDLRPVFEEWEADFGRTFVVGSDPAKLKIRDTLEPMWKDVKAHFDANADMSGEQLFATACESVKRAGYEFGGPHSGHLVGEFPHGRVPKDQVSLYITKGSVRPVRSLNKQSPRRHWILEIHFVDKDRQIGGSFEQLLTVD